MGLFGYFRDYIANYAQIAKPLTDMTLKGVPQIIPWDEKAQRAFECLKAKLCEASVLAIPRPGEPISIVVDASSFAVGACALQADSDGRERPIAYLSQKLSPAQTKWSTIEREAFAVICALKKWHTIVFSADIVIYSDHNPLTYIVVCPEKRSIDALVIGFAAVFC